MMKCPVCGKTEFERKNNFEICEVCFWENDGLQLSDPDYEGGANKESLNQYRELHKAGKVSAATYGWTGHEDAESTAIAV